VCCVCEAQNCPFEFLSVCVCVMPKIVDKNVSNTQIFVLLTIYVENNNKKKACNHTNPTNSPQSRTERKPAITPMQQTAHNHIFTTTKRKPAITTIQQIARNHVWKESLQSHQCNKQPTITYSQLQKESLQSQQSNK